jgi:hypothetical protein
VLLTSYGMVLHNAEALAVPPRWLRAEEEDGPLWDFMFLDEVPPGETCRALHVQKGCNQVAVMSCRRQQLSLLAGL